MPVDIEQWRAEIGNINGCLHYTIITLELNLFNIIVRVSQALALMLAIISQYIFKINTDFYLLNIIFVFFLFIVLRFTATDTILCFKFKQHFHKQIPFWNCLNTSTVVNVVPSGYLLRQLLFQPGGMKSNSGPRNEQANKDLSCCHWNVNSSLAQNLAKISQTEHNKSVFNHDFIWISETYFDSLDLEGDRSF